MDTKGYLYVLKKFLEILTVKIFQINRSDSM